MNQNHIIAAILSAPFILGAALVGPIQKVANAKPVPYMDTTYISNVKGNDYYYNKMRDRWLIENPDLLEVEGEEIIYLAEDETTLIYSKAMSSQYTGYMITYNSKLLSSFIKKLQVNSIPYTYERSTDFKMTVTFDYAMIDRDSENDAWVIVR